ncbi:hypothetical protein PRIPAC_88281 [Pristionchus pacificus]|uniref:Uncharacterized protein n=1 Tax=Pristionchus pacificus TaxID=54126 RepID=A0A2A6B8M2_PRIPA|nr:hypothetical protein PRIPAC_88281 [Pristionchus pacificus]|eukprot:PDM62203.1 hypothetical protein PRIPAC_51645 [Pristionchus pacificus]
MSAAALLCVLLLLVGGSSAAPPPSDDDVYPVPKPSDLPDDVTECTASRQPGKQVLCYEAPSCGGNQNLFNDDGSLLLASVDVTTPGCKTIVKTEHVPVGQMSAHRVQMSLAIGHRKVHSPETVFADASKSPSTVHCKEYTKDGATKYCEQLGERKRIMHGDRLFLVHYLRLRTRNAVVVPPSIPTPQTPPPPAPTDRLPTTTTRVPTTKKIMTTTTTTKKITTTTTTTKRTTTTAPPAVHPEDDHHDHDHDHDADHHESGGVKPSVTAKVITIVVPLIIVALFVAGVWIYCKQKNATGPRPPYNAPSTNVSTGSVPRVSPSARFSPSVRKDPVEEKEKSPSVVEKVVSVISSKSIPKKSAERENLDCGSKSIPNTPAERENLDLKSRELAWPELQNA